MTKENWQKRKNIWKDERIITWRKKGLSYPQSEDISVIKASDGWLVNYAGYKGDENYFSENLLSKTTKKEALKKAIKHMMEN